MSKNKRKSAPNRATKQILQQNAAAKEREQVIVPVEEATAPETLVEEQVVPTEVVELVSVEETPVEEPVEETPVEEPAEETPVEEPAEEAPVEEPAEETPVEEPAEEAPVEEPAEEAPVEEPAEETSVEEPAEETPVEEPAEETPVEEPAEETPVEEPAEETPVEEPAEETPVEELVEETPVEEPAKEKTVEEKPDAKDDNNFKKAIITGGAIGLVLLFGTFVVMLCLLFRSNNGPVENTQETESTIETTETTVTTETTETTETAETTETTETTETEKPDVQESFDIKAFEQEIAGQAEFQENSNAVADAAMITLTMSNLEEIVTNNKFENIDEDMIARELAVMLTHAANIMGELYAQEIGSEYLSTDEYFDALLVSTDYYKAATGKNPETVLMSLPNYETIKSNAAAILAEAKTVLSEEEYKLFEEWYTARNSNYAAALKVENYIKDMKAKLLQNKSKGTEKFFQKQLEAVNNGLVTVKVKTVTDEYREFVWTYCYLWV